MIKNLVLALSIASLIALAIEKIGYREVLNEQDKEIQTLRKKLQEEKLTSAALGDQAKIIVEHVTWDQLSAILNELDEKRNKLKFDQIVSQF